MPILFYFFIFIFGLCVGSFLNVLIYRLGGHEQSEDSPPIRRTVLRRLGGRSYCPKCAHQLGWRDLVPVLSFFWLHGRCRYCERSISYQYPIVELTTGILFVLVAFPISNEFSISQYPNIPISGIYLLFIISCLIVIFVSDLKYFIIPDEIIIAGIAGTLLYKLFVILDFGHWNLFGIWNLEFGIWRPLFNSLLSAIVTSAFFLSIVLITRGRGMGLGDVKLAFLMGLILGWPKILVALLLAFVSGALVGLGLILAGRAKLKSEIPFGTFLSAATFLVMIFGDLWQNGSGFFRLFLL